MASLRDDAYAELRHRIVNLVYAPGQRLFERDLAAELSVSRIPLREALQSLRNDGLVVSVPRQGVVVAHFTADDVRDLFDVRESLESLAARLAAARVGDDGLGRLRASMAAARTALGAGDDSAVAAANAAFHRELVVMAANPLLSAMMRPLEARTQWLFNLTSRRDPEPVSTWETGCGEVQAPPGRTSHKPTYNTGMRTSAPHTRTAPGPRLAPPPTSIQALVQKCDEHQGLYEAVAAGAADRAGALAFTHVASGRKESIALAAAWSAGVVDPVEATRTRRRLTEPAGSTPAAPPA
ncbi:DNA-binding GntR family transcriptional regulator [Catenuloplanes nepalensis]|uniref:DNA-binding GntR family transcriptional regulator n=1 Tax=Catenuloplanes nepalensis TaxID=587533 RepID=A0ABT9MPV9_9ACTN|nr:GntR family transcriptional regulator [Catenuloplanes nepalensis]MDP9793442.1 DNA-binding GntR family transcriptional regulator [Catenuloplanes nepalensis]